MMMFWTCPVEAHGVNRNADGREMPTVDWVGNVAHCLTPGCKLTNEPGEIVVEVETYYPTGTGRSDLAEPCPRDFAAEVRAHSSGQYQVAAGPRLVNNKTFLFELHPDVENNPEDYLYPLAQARHVATVMANRRTINGKNYHEWVLEAASRASE